MKMLVHGHTQKIHRPLRYVSNEYNSDSAARTKLPVQFLSASHRTFHSYLYAHYPYGIAPTIAMFVVLYIIIPFLLIENCAGQSVTPGPSRFLATNVGCIGIAADSSS